MTQNVKILIEKVNELKARTKEATAELKTVLETTQVFQDVLRTAMEDTRYNLFREEKMAKAYALKVALKFYSPKEEEDN